MLVPGAGTAQPAKSWVDTFIFDTRRKSGRQTESSVLRLWKVVPFYDYSSQCAYTKLLQSWCRQALLSGTITDEVIDANHIIEYLKFAATRNLLTSRGHERETAQRLSPVCLIYWLKWALYANVHCSHLSKKS